MPEARQTIIAAGAPDAIGPYSHAVRSGGLLFCSGQIPADPATGELVAGGVAAQTVQCLENLAVVCRAGGAQLADAVRMSIYVTDMATFADVNAAYAAFFPDAPPARSTIGVASLPRGADVEIDAIVAIQG